jgi:hypothetical protein
MKRSRIAALVVITLALPLLARADDWVRKPSGEEGGGGEPAATSSSRSGTDNQAIDNVRTQLGSAQDPCEIIGLFAASAATARDQQVPKDEQVQNADCNFSRVMAQTRVGLDWSPPFQILLNREIDYVYDNPDMNSAQVMEHWMGLCEGRAASQRTAIRQPRYQQPRVETLPMP